MADALLATSQIVSLDLRSGERQVLTEGPGREYSPRWVGGGIAYTRGDVHEKRGARERVNYVSYGIAFTDGRPELRGTFSNVNWSPDGGWWRDRGRWEPRGSSSWIWRPER